MMNAVCTLVPPLYWELLCARPFEQNQEIDKGMQRKGDA